MKNDGESENRSMFTKADFDPSVLPDNEKKLIDDEGLTEFAKALVAPEPSTAYEDLQDTPDSSKTQYPHFITALNDWRPIRQRVRKRRRPDRRGADETREGFVYTLLKWPLLLFVLGWLLWLGIAYLVTRVYIFGYEKLFAWRGKRGRLRNKLRNTTTYPGWKAAAQHLDAHLGNEAWKGRDQYAYYDHRTVKRVRDHLIEFRQNAEADETRPSGPDPRPIDELKSLLEACVKNNFAGTENPRLYSESYYGTKNLVQSYLDELERSLTFIIKSNQIDPDTKRHFFRHLRVNFGRTALCLSGGASFAYYHFGVAKALVDANLFPEVLTGTSGGALVAALLATRTDDELKKLLVPALAHKITACHDDIRTWVTRWWRTGARFDAVDWAERCSWFTRGSTTFKEAFERTGRILNVSCIPSDPHSPAILANYLTAPDCVIWSAVIASAAVPGILNPVVLMKKTRDKHGKEMLTPYSFGHKWKDGSLRTDIPIRSLNLHFNVNFTIVSQVNPHINLFFFSSRGTVGRPVTHRRGRGWRGGFLGSALEQYLKLDLTKWLKVLRHLELLPRPLGTDWSEIWLQLFSGTITIWPKSVPSDFVYILSDPTPQRLARMIRMGMLSTWPKLRFIENRMKIERLIDEGRRATRIVGSPNDGRPLAASRMLSEEDLQTLLQEVRKTSNLAPAAVTSDNTDDEDAFHFGGAHASGSRARGTMKSGASSPLNSRIPTSHLRNIDDIIGSEPEDGRDGQTNESETETEEPRGGQKSPTLAERLSSIFNPSSRKAEKRSGLYRSGNHRALSMFELRGNPSAHENSILDHPDEPSDEVTDHRRGSKHSVLNELRNQSRVFWDDDFSSSGGEEEGGYRNVAEVIYGTDGEMDAEHVETGIGNAEKIVNGTKGTKVG
ncbi:patatin-domain-containing protein [Eremomyces bilateralis CBS 781.70]|uniref:Patatin-domain-containing protein n=1 Tax=Eremomyces bilateralis CBS 781.70 TaxID=1392243 RepID=A0A6G1GC34_9PEZI|nr:patatin-domain-containing protein [Eremomyces bilateralis CBS 781.70]KAF1815460.1 patatin-domain-containing protein [Eremomyces bilateralis CBS 781.70]